jgi:hypothetical protein
MKALIKIVYLILFLMGLISNPSFILAQIPINDSKDSDLQFKEKYDQFYDSLRLRAEKKKFTKWLHHTIIHEPKEAIDKEALTLSYFNPYKDKTIASIEIKALEVFGPSLNDTTLKAKSKVQIWANSVHTKTNLNIIRKNLLFKVGDKLKPQVLYDNERIIRTLNFIKDVKFLLTPDTINPELVRVTVLTKDVFSFGVTGRASGLSSASFEVYNQNIFGAGHEVSVGLAGHLYQAPFLGFETFYRIPNIKGKFINFSVGFSNTFSKEGFSLNLEREFLTSSTVWGGGISALRLSRSDRITDYDPVRIDDAPLDFALWQFWGGRTFQFNKDKYNNSQLTISTNITHQLFYDRPLPDNDNRQYFSNSTFYLSGLTWSKRTYMRDQLIYGYGITEDIPQGFKNEIVLGYDANEFGDRFYTHLIFANGNLLPRRPGYLYLSGGIGGYFDNMKFEQGLVNVKANYISRLITTGEKRYRLFVGFDYMIGIRRFDVENLLVRYNNLIRGFSSSNPQGKQRLSLNLETVFFQRKEIYNFNIALFAFSDMVIIGSNRNFILKENYYGGVGIGIRLHNESLVLKTIQLRLSFYPNHPDNMGFVGFVLEEQLKSRFYSFQPSAPVPLRFE